MDGVEPKVVPQIGPQQLKTIQDRIRAMISERAKHPSKGMALQTPSEYWRYFTERTRYLTELSPESLRLLRVHTFHLTGDNYLNYYLGADAARFRRNVSWDGLVSGLPSRYVLREPPGGIGYTYEDGSVISVDITRFQRVVRSLFRKGIIESLEAKPRPRVLEIGGGYGGLAHHLLNLLPQAQYTIIDLPETLFFSAVYLSMHNPSRRMYLYNPADFRRARSRGFNDYEVVLLPTWILPDLRDERFDLALNIDSLQEMTQVQVEEYLDFVQRTCAGPFYSLNMDRNPANRELKSLEAAIGPRFRVEPAEPRPTDRTERFHRLLRRWAARVGLTGQPLRPYHEWFCQPLPPPPG